MRTPAQDVVRQAVTCQATATNIEVSPMARIRLCQCGAPPLYGPWCWACSHEQERHREPLAVIAWDAVDID
ncbi:hypothetical protein DEJ37_14530 [Kocuria rosea]|nr:hypothetical protein DEJ37_14530 [Kocuria rosea]